MKHAIMIIAHNNFEMLSHVVDYFKEGFYVFIHIDKKAIVDKDVLSDLEAKPQVVRIYRKFCVHWGGFSMLKCELFLMREAISLTDADYFHLLSGQDYPIKPVGEFKKFFEQRNGWEFVSYVHLPHKNFQNNTYDRLCYYFPYDWFADKKKASKYVGMLFKWQKKHHIKRSVPNCFDHLYGGSQWFSITRMAVEKILQYTLDFPKFYKRLRWTFAPEEVYIVTLLLNLIPKCSVINNNLRIVRWKFENGNFPANLSAEHFHLLVESDALFARKINQQYGVNLSALIDKYLLSNITCAIDRYGWSGLYDIQYDSGFVEAVYKYCKMAKIEEGVDCGCGVGHYVAAFRRLGLKFTGFDVNADVVDYSKLLLPKNDTSCVQADLVDELSVSGFFDIAICVDVMQYIPVDMLDKVFFNLSKLTNNTIVLAWNDEFEKYYNGMHLIDEIKRMGFCEDIFASSFFKIYSKRKKHIRVLRSVKILNIL